MKNVSPIELPHKNAFSSAGTSVGVHEDALAFLNVRNISRCFLKQAFTRIPKMPNVTAASPEGQSEDKKIPISLAMHDKLIQISEQDDRLYRHITLPNQMQVGLIFKIHFVRIPFSVLRNIPSRDQKSRLIARYTVITERIWYFRVNQE